MTPPTPTAPPRPRRLGRRLLESPLLGLLAGPPGVDGYLEQVRPTWAAGVTAWRERKFSVPARAT